MTAIESPLPAQEIDDGFAFRFELPSEDLALRSVRLEDGVPIFDFTASKKVPCISEEDVASIVKVVQDGKRPGFVYAGILPGHPLHSIRRHYKQYDPADLRRSSVGEFLAEIDWLMKCLSVGVRSDKDRKKFCSWSETSNIDGLPSKEDFPFDKPHGSIFLKCKSAEIAEEEDMLLFSKDPEMMIENECSSSFSKFFTEHYDSVAYHDEPAFLKMKEIIKLILAIEWMKKKGVKFSKNWLEEHKPVNRDPPKPLQVKLSEKESKSIIEELKKETEKAIEGAVAKPNTAGVVSRYQDRVSVKQPKVTVSDQGIEVELEKTIADPWFEHTTGLYIPLVVRAVTRVSASNDLDFVYSDEDPNQPVCFDLEATANDRAHHFFSPSGNDEAVCRPNVSSWADLLSETEVIPCKWFQDPNNPLRRTPELTGGVSTSSIPTRKVATPASVPVAKKVSVRASKNGASHKVRSRDVPSQSAVRAPPSDVCVNTPEAQMNRAIKEERPMYGYKTGSTSYGQSSDGHTIKEAALNGTTKITQLVNGKEVLPPLHLDMHIPLPPKEGSPTGTDSGLSSMVTSPSSSTSQLPAPSNAATVKDDQESIYSASDSGLSDMTVCDDTQSDGTLDGDDMDAD